MRVEGRLGEGERGRGVDATWERGGGWSHAGRAGGGTTRTGENEQERDVAAVVKPRNLLWSLLRAARLPRDDGLRAWRQILWTHPRRRREEEDEPRENAT